MKRLVLGLICVAFPASAQEGPVTTPTRDVDVVYRSAAGPQVLEQRSRYRVADGKLRLDPPSPGVYMILDQRAHTMAVVSAGNVLDMKLRDNKGPGGFAAGHHFTRGGVDAVAGLACTEWQTVDSQGQPVAVCFTGDGVLLRARRGAAVLLQATRVTYGQLDPAAFVVPPGYTHARPQEPPP